MATEINQKIVGYKVVDKSAPTAIETPPASIGMHEGLVRPEILMGKTYKIKPPHLDHAIYVTINDMNIDGVMHPREIFINSKCMENFQWITAMTRTVSAIWRKGGNIEFLVEEFKSVFDPKGGYWKKGGRFMPSLVAEIGHIIEVHCGLVPEKIVVEKAVVLESGEYPPGATLCSKCNTKALVILDGCQTCLACGDSKCG